MMRAALTLVPVILLALPVSAQNIPETRASLIALRTSTRKVRREVGPFATFSGPA